MCFCNKNGKQLQEKLKESEKQRVALEKINHDLIEENQKLKLNLQNQRGI